MTNFCALVRK